MISHLTEDQISRWFIGQSSATEQRHVQVCRACTAELEHFLSAVGSFKTTMTLRADRLTRRRQPNLAIVLSGSVDAPFMFRPIERADDFRHTRWLSLVVHAVVLALLIIPVAITGPSTKTLVTALYNNTVPLILDVPRPAESGGGGGGGMKAPTPPSKGVLPRGADKQLVPPMVEPKNMFPDLVVESTIVAPQLANVRPLGLQLGDPNGVSGPLSAGPGTGGGIGTGIGTGVGGGRGGGAGPGDGGGIGGGVFNVGGGVSEPVLLSQTQPEYSDDARKARIQGTVELLVIVNPDGTVKFDTVRQSLGYGLDQRAIDAVKKWKFLPGKKDGKAVATYVSVLVNFSLR
jgi:TonB family protein